MDNDSFTVTKRHIEQFEIAIGNSLPGEGLLLTRHEAKTLHANLSTALEYPIVTLKQCDDRFSHKSHFEKLRSMNSDDIFYTFCTGRSTDMT